MKKILMVLFLGALLNCSEPSATDSIDDGLVWLNVVEPLTESNSSNATGTALLVDKDYINADYNSNNIAVIEFDDAKDYVGVERGRIVEGEQQHIMRYRFVLQDYHSIKVTKGDITDEQFALAVSRPIGHSVTWQTITDNRFDVQAMPGFEDIPIGTVLAKLEVSVNDTSGWGDGYHAEDVFYLVL